MICLKHIFLHFRWRHNAPSRLEAVGKFVDLTSSHSWLMADFIVPLNKNFFIFGLTLFSFWRWFLLFSPPIVLYGSCSVSVLVPHKSPTKKKIGLWRNGQNPYSLEELNRFLADQAQMWAHGYYDAECNLKWICCSRPLLFWIMFKMVWLLTAIML